MVGIDELSGQWPAAVTGEITLPGVGGVDSGLA